MTVGKFNWGKFSRKEKINREIIHVIAIDDFYFPLFIWLGYLSDYLHARQLNEICEIWSSNHCRQLTFNLALKLIWQDLTTSFKQDRYNIIIMQFACENVKSQWDLSENDLGEDREHSQRAISENDLWYPKFNSIIISAVSYKLKPIYISRIIILILVHELIWEVPGKSGIFWHPPDMN